MSEATPAGWLRVPLTALVEQCGETVGRANKPIVLSSTKYRGLVSSDEYFQGRTIYSDDLYGYKLVKRHWLAYATNHLAEGSIGLQDRYDAGCVSPIYTVFRCREGVDPYFLYRLLKSPALLAQYELREQASVNRRGAIRFSDFATICVTVPESRDEQQRIAGILDVVDERIQYAEQWIAKAEVARRATLVDLLAREPYPRQPLSALLTGDANAMRSGPFGSSLLTSEFRSSGVPVLGIDNVLLEEFKAEYKRFVGLAKFRELRRYSVKPHDVMITIMGTVGRCCVIPENIGSALSSKHVWTMTIDPTRYRPWLVCLQINYAPWVHKHFSRDSQGGIMSAIRSETLKTLPLPVPSMNTQLRIESVLQAQADQIRAERAELDKLRLLKRGLMDDLLTGKVRVGELQG